MGLGLSRYYLFLRTFLYIRKIKLKPKFYGLLNFLSEGLFHYLNLDCPLLSSVQHFHFFILIVRHPSVPSQRETKGDRGNENFDLQSQLSINCTLFQKEIAWKTSKQKACYSINILNNYHLIPLLPSSSFKNY